MDIFDKIFTKTDAEEGKKKGKMYFGRLLIKLRSENHIKLYSLMESVSNTVLDNDVLKITLSDGGAYAMLNNPKDLATINDVLCSIESGVRVELNTTDKKTFNSALFEEKLRQEFGKIVVIK